MASMIEIKCDKCDIVFEYDKGSILNDTPKDIECPKCKSSKHTHRVYGILATSVAEGLAGNASTNYSTSITYHKNSLAPSVKGTKIK